MMASKWDGIKSKKILSALRTALSDDKALSHSEVVEIVRAALEDGYLTSGELDDLNLVAASSGTMMDRSKMMLAYLVTQTVAVTGGKGPFSLAGSRKKYAADIICNFMKLKGTGVFPKLDRDLVGVDLLMRVGNPDIINQRMAGICGPVAFLYSLACDSPAAYAKYAIDLYEKGKAKIGRIKVEPGADCRNFSPPPSMSRAEWLTAASLRDSENYLLDFDDVDRNFSGGTSIADLIVWFERAGYTDVQYESNTWTSRGSEDINDLNQLYRNGYRIILRINSKMLYVDKQDNTSGFGNHFVVLRSTIASTDQGVRLTVFTWGKGEYQIPHGGALSQKDFLGNLYGYVAAKPF